jgi:hypothetical protein
MAIDKNGTVLSQGDRLMDITGPGDRILIDYKKMRQARQGFYPLTRYNWQPLGNIKLNR